MSETTEIEKKSQEAHVELCAYKILETKLLEVESDIKEVKTHVSDIGEKIDVMSNKRTDQVIAWGMGIIGFLGATVMWLLQQYVFK